MRPFQGLDDSDFASSGLRVTDGLIYAAPRYVIVYGEQPSAPFQHLPIAPPVTPSGVAALENQHLVRAGERVKIRFSPELRPMAGLGLTGEVAMEPNVGEVVISELQNLPRNPDIRPHVHPDPEQADAVVYCNPKLPFDKTLYLRLMEGQILRL